MASEWDEVRLDRLYHFSSGLSKPRSDFGSGYPFLTFKDVFYNFFVPAELTELVNSTERERRSCSIERGDVFLTRTSETMDELGMSCVALRDYENATFNGFTKRLRPKSGTSISPEFVGYYFRSPKFRRDVTAMSSLSTRASLNNEMIARITVALPPAAEQAAIGRVLKVLDDKVEVNRRTYKTLETIAHALFRSWFIDFDPVRAKAAGRDPSLPTTVADIFPDRFEGSELGEIPKGWRVRQVASAIDFVRGVEPGRSGCNEEGRGLPFIRVGDVTGKRASDLFTESVSEPRCQIGDILLALDGTPGAVAIHLSGVFSSGIRKLVPKKHGDLPPIYVWSLAVSDRFQRTVSEHARGTTIQHAGSAVGYLRDIDPGPHVMAAFSAIAMPFWDRLLSLQREGRSLVAVRNTLLPRLISGEIRVAQAEKMLAAAPR